MQKRAPVFSNSAPRRSTRSSLTPCSPSVEIAELKQCIEEGLVHCEYQQYSARTTEVRRMFLTNLVWFLEHRDYESCGTRELQQFFHYLRTGHEEAGGRWGNPQLTKPLRPITIRDYYIGISAFFKWMIKAGELESSPMERLERIRVREEIKQPLTPEQTGALLRAAKTSNNPYRDEAILWMLFDTGIRASELINLKVQDIDLKAGSFQVVGKGNKLRSYY